jgi:hypothetical protein
MTVRFRRAGRGTADDGTTSAAASASVLDELARAQEAKSTATTLALRGALEAGHTAAVSWPYLWPQRLPRRPFGTLCVGLMRFALTTRSPLRAGAQPDV